MDTTETTPWRVAVFDDSAEVHTLFRRLLEPEGVEVVSYFHPMLTENGMADLAASKPSLIVVDLLLGESRFDGYDLIRNLQQVEALRPVPIVVCSKYINSSTQGQIEAKCALSLPGVVAALSKIPEIDANDILRWLES